MEMINIIPSDNKLWEQAWRLYTDSFPEYERRRISSHSLAVDDPHFHTKIAVENGNLVALLFYWTFGDDNIYIEHIAVNPLMRGKKIGSSLLSSFLSQNSRATVILEIDPPSDQISVRRHDFYGRLGFMTNEYDYIHPSYQKKGQHHKLVILSHPRIINDIEFNNFQEFMKSNVLKYID